jgi:hypothetical protein
MDVVWIGAPYPARHRQHDGIVARIRPRLKVIGIHPDDVRNILKAMTKVSTKGLRLVSAIRLEGGEPADGFDRIQQNRNAMRRCNSKHLIDALEVQGLGSRYHLAS